MPRILLLEFNPAQILTTHSLVSLTPLTINQLGIKILPTPKDSISQFNDNWDTMIAMKKINSSDITQVVK